MFTAETIVQFVRTFCTAVTELNAHDDSSVGPENRGVSSVWKSTVRAALQTNTTHESYMPQLNKSIFFILHFVFGFLTLWQFYYYIQLTVPALLTANLMLKTFLEVGFILICVVFGNSGWDSLKLLTPSTTGSELVKELSRSLAPMLIVLPVFSVLFDFAQNVSLVDFSWALSRLPLTWLGISLLVGVLLIYYQRNSDRMRLLTNQSR
ncbi:MAG: hypothetical protein ACREPB_05520 [Arenimonas sp.]